MKISKEKLMIIVILVGLHGCLSEEDEILSNLCKKRRF